VDSSDAERRIKAYEAEAIPIRQGHTDADPTLFSPFGPLIGRRRIDPLLIDHLNSEVDLEIPDGVSSELALSLDLLCNTGPKDRSLLTVFAESVSRFVQLAHGSRPSEITFDAVWIVSQYANTASPMHFHSGDVAGILYLKTPAMEPCTSSDNYLLGRRRGEITFLHSGRQFLSRSVISFVPVVGDLYLFPAWLLHGVEPFDVPGERRSLSFNARVDCSD
jgi:hypothetical protein